MELNFTLQWTLNKKENLTTEMDVRILAMSYMAYKIGEYAMKSLTETLTGIERIHITSALEFSLNECH